MPADNQDTQAILDQLAETGKPYEQDLHLSEIAQLSRLAQPSAAPTAAEPPTNIPLTLTIQTGPSSAFTPQALRPARGIIRRGFHV